MQFEITMCKRKTHNIKNECKNHIHQFYFFLFEGNDYSSFKKQEKNTRAEALQKAFRFPPIHLEWRGASSC